MARSPLVQKRIDLGISQRQMARVLGFSPEELNDFERGNKEINIIEPHHFWNWYDAILTNREVNKQLAKANARVTELEKQLKRFKTIAQKRAKRIKELMPFYMESL